LLRLLDDHRIPASWFIPGHTINTFPGTCRNIADALRQFLPDA
jgi:peptidoglycan/xylan/chitin deacetylase (PgdA/CDA1 family)